MSVEEYDQHEKKLAQLEKQRKVADISNGIHGITVFMAEGFL